MNTQQGSLGYNIALERKNHLAMTGEDIQRVSKIYKDAFPQNNPIADPLGVLDILNQLTQGACVGHAGALIFSICYFLATGRRAAFSRAAGYYLAQRASGITGDNGATIEGFQRVATGTSPFKGLCLESDWRYPSQYDPREPVPAPKYLYKLKVTKPFTRLQECLDWLDLGLPLHNGMPWGSASNREVVSNWSPGAGGHSTVWWQRKSSGNIWMLNSWGDWMVDGCNEWTADAIGQALAHPYTAVVGYAPDGMSFPDPDPI